ncbi:MAG: NAD(P)H-binding protein [Gammaproteobacteria bacterium]|nr:NAD(P)H-binding protein [Gammaproteobacteria bacterium]
MANDATMKTALVLGGSGLIGRMLIDELLASGHYGKVTALLRKELSAAPAELDQQIVDFESLLTEQLPLVADDVFCCLGTTQKTVGGDKDKFYRIDHDYPVELAKLAQAGGAKRCFVVSATGANSKSRFYYNRVKGDMERDLKTLGFDALHIYQPSLLIGSREHLDQLNRGGEFVGQKLMPLMNPFLQGSLRKFRPTHATAVAQAMCADSGRDSRGVEIHHFE